MRNEFVPCPKCGYFLIKTSTSPSCNTWRCTKKDCNTVFTLIYDGAQPVSRKMVEGTGKADLQHRLFVPLHDSWQGEPEITYLRYGDIDTLNDLARQGDSFAIYEQDRIKELIRSNHPVRCKLIRDIEFTVEVIGEELSLGKQVGGP